MVRINDLAILRGPRHVLFGRGAVGAVGRLTAEHGQRALVCTDPAIAVTPILAAVLDSLTACGVAFEVFDGALPDLPVDVLDDALTAARRARPDVLVGVGGGSSLDLTKLTALLLRHPAPIEEYYGENRVPGPVTPIIAVPTTAGTGSEVTPVAVVSDSRRVLKVGVSSPHLVPVGAVCDPALTDGAPATVTAHAGIDALAHAIEAFTAVARTGEPVAELEKSRVFVGKNLLSDLFAREAIASIYRNLARAVAHPDDRAARNGMAYGSTLAGFAFAAAGTSAAHVLQYPLGARTSTPHGLGVGLLLPYAMEFNRPVRTPELAEVAAAMRPTAASIPPEEAAVSAVRCVVELAAEIGIPGTLQELGVRREELPEMAEQAAGVTRLIENNPRRLDRPALLALLDAAWSGDSTALAGPATERTRK